ncbi:hypothetical protein ACOSP7_004353 [Xanthoceras sorbifolium]
MSFLGGSGVELDVKKGSLSAFMVDVTAAVVSVIGREEEQYAPTISGRRRRGRGGRGGGGGVCVGLVWKM